MEDLQLAVSAAIGAAKKFLGEIHFSNLQLEEVEKTDDGKYWIITLGFDVIDTTGTSGIFGPLNEIRKYKTFKIDSKTYEVVSMKIKQL